MQKRKRNSTSLPVFQSILNKKKVAKNKKIPTNSYELSQINRKEKFVKIRVIHGLKKKEV
jgi:hypothetical protein